MDSETYLPLTARELHILLALAGPPQCGYRISILAEENSGGRVRLGPATQYTNLHRLVERRLVHDVTEGVEDRGDGRAQRFWSLTDAGRRVLKAEARRLAADIELVLSRLGEEGA